MFYLEHCPYGTRTISDYDTLMIFETRKERDEMVDRLNAAIDDLADGCAMPVTRREVAHRYDFEGFKDPRAAAEVFGLRTCAGRTVRRIHHKPSYRA